MLKRLSKKRNSAHLERAVVKIDGGTNQQNDDDDEVDIVTTSTTQTTTSTAPTTAARTSEQRNGTKDTGSRNSYVDAQTPPASPKPVGTSADKAMTREAKIAMLLAKAAPRPDETVPAGGSGALARSLTLPRGSSYSVPKSNGLASESSTGAIESPRAVVAAPDNESAPSSPRKLERSISYTPPSPRPQSPRPQSPRPLPMSTTLTLITTAVASLSPRGDKEKRRSRNNSFAGTSIDSTSRGTFTRIVYFASPVALLTAAKVYLVPNNVVTEGIHAALAQAHVCEFGVGTGDTGENEMELKIAALLLLDKGINPRHKVSMQQKARFTGQPGMLAEYLQPGAPEVCIGKTTITHEYIFKNAI